MYVEAPEVARIETRRRRRRIDCGKARKSVAAAGFMIVAARCCDPGIETLGPHYLGNSGRSLMSIHDGKSYLAVDRERPESNGRSRSSPEESRFRVSLLVTVLVRHRLRLVEMVARGYRSVLFMRLSRFHVRAVVAALGIKNGFSVPRRRNPLLTANRLHSRALISRAYDDSLK